MQGQFSIGLTEDLDKLRVAIPGYPSMYHTMSVSAGGGWGGWGARDFQENLDSSSLGSMVSGNAPTLTVTIMRSGTRISACVNGQQVIAPTEVGFWANGTVLAQPMAHLPFSERDGELYYGWRTPQLWGDQGGQPPDFPSKSVPGEYVHSRYSTQSYSSCAAAEMAMSDATTLPAVAPSNLDPTIYLRSSLGSSFHINDEPEFTVTITDPNADTFHATITLYGTPPDECNWPQVRFAPWMRAVAHSSCCSRRRDAS